MNTHLDCKYCGYTGKPILEWVQRPGESLTLRADCARCLTHIRVVAQTPEWLFEAPSAFSAPGISGDKK